VKILTVCEEGLNRSVAARWLLQHQGHEVIPIGLNRTTPDTLHMLFDWADRIILLDMRLVIHAPPAKLIVWDVGPDHYEHHYHPDLVRQLRQFPPLE
jgi:hypothetical protein